MEHRILVVDDSEELLKITGTALRNAGYLVSTANNVNSALSILDEFKPHLILCDVIMPEQDGYDLLRSLRKYKKYDEIFFVFISSKVFAPPDQAAAINSGADGYLERPDDIRDLLVRISSFISSHTMISNLKTKNYQLLSLLENITDSIIVVSEAGKILYANPPSSRLFNRQLSEILNSELGYPVNPGKAAEIEIISPGGKIKNAEMTVSNFQWSGQPAFLCTIRDITERVKQIKSIQKLNQLYTYLSMVNTRLLKIQKINEIFEAAAEIAVEYGTFRGVKFCRIDTEFYETRKLSFRVASDIDEDIADLLFEPFTSEQMIIERLISTKSPIIYNKIKEKNLLMQNIESAAIIPFNFNPDHLYIVIYFAAERDFFDEQELNLLNEVTEDLEVVIDKITTESERNILIAKQQSLVNILMSISEAVIETDLNFTVKFWNSGAENIYLWNTNEVIGRDLRVLLKSEFINTTRDEIIKRVFSDGVAKFEVFHFRKDGKRIYVEANTMAEKDISENVIGYVTVARDMTKLKIASEKLKAEKDALKRIFDHIPIMLTRFDPATQLLFVNKEFEKKIGWTNEDLPGINLMEECYPDPEYRAIASEYMINAKLEWKEFKVKTKWGDYLSSVWSNVKLTDGTMIGIGIDLTDKKLMEQQLVEARDKAEEMARLKASFLANMSHEIRTPMIGIIGYSELLSEEIPDAELRKMAESIHKSATRLLETLNLILDLSKIEAEKMTIALHEVDLIRLTSEIVDSFMISAKNKGLYLQMESDMNELKISSDERILGQVLNNLINNSIKFTFKGGIKILLSKDTINEIDYAVIKCRDSGIGIPEEKQAFIWDEFRQVSEGIGRNFEGTGLGLTLTKKFVDKINGEIYVESEVGKGTTFTVLLPMNHHDPAVQKFIEKVNFVIPVDSRPKDFDDNYIPEVLYVEDDEISIEIVSNFLKDICRIDCVQNAEAALEKAASKMYTLILMDINLRRGLDGVQLTRILRANPQLKEIPIIAVTAFAMNGDRESFLASGMTDYISKPFTKDDLIKIVQKYLQL